ncbi:murein biosynthesis integral membrane protein MurJ [Domibacillus aminovorans]|uniref:Lipid II flippase n=1 Tax=Domibacillus aminovorans TaxID=29332 RepID=A0A177L0K1_9BACI|nr:murein biosynthesis integral membrane protein MurJ [Domibacillus aminovorans]OAH58962.1 hypothetical protein AWH49_04670 [Domibacillus aminovorans]
MGTLRNTLLLILILSLCSKGIGFLRDLMITNYVGFNAKTDAIFVSISIVTLIFSVFNTTIRTTFSPLFSSRYLKEKAAVLEEYNNIQNLFLLPFIIISLTVYLFPGFIISIFTPGLNEDSFSYSVNFLKILSFMLIFYGFYYLSTGFLQSIKIYKTVEIGTIINNFTIIACIAIFFQKYNIYSVVIGYVIGSILQFMYAQWVLRKKTNIKFKPKIRFRDKNFNEYISTSKYIVFGSLVTQLTVISDKFVASFFDAGSITALHYASTVKNLPLNIVILVVTNVLFTNLSILKEESKEKFDKLITLQVKYLLYLICPIIVIFICYSEELIRLLFYRGAFTEQGIEMTSQALVAYAIGLFFWVIKEVYTKAAYASKNIKIPFYTSILSLFINLIFNVILGYFLGHIGIALATSLSIAVNCFFLMNKLEKNGIVENKKEMLTITMKNIIFLFIVIFFINILDEFLFFHFDYMIRIIIGSIIIFLIYISCAKLLGIEINKFMRGK